MPNSAELQGWIQIFAGAYTLDLWSGSPQEFIRFSTSLRNDPEFLRFYQALAAHGEPVKLEIKNRAPDGAVGALSFSGKSYHLKLRGATLPRVSGLLEYESGAINFAVEGNVERLELWFWSSSFVEAPVYPDVISIVFKPDNPSPLREQVFAQKGFTFRYPIGWTIRKEKSRLGIQSDRWFGDSLLQIFCFETHGSGQAVVEPVLEALVHLMTAHAEDETPKLIGKIRTAQAFGKPGQLLSFEQRKFTKQGQWYETRIRTFVVFHEDAAVVLWAEGPPDGVKKRDDLLLRIFSTFSGHRPVIANHPTRGNNSSPLREATAASREKINEAVTNYITASATTGRDLFLHIGDHPELLTDEAIEIFETLVRQAKLVRAANDPKLTNLINRRDILLKAHQAMHGGYLETVLAEARSEDT
jgi:hypothetical protein